MFFEKNVSKLNIVTKNDLKIVLYDFFMHTFSKILSIYFVSIASKSFETSHTIPFNATYFIP